MKTSFLLLLLLASFGYVAADGIVAALGSSYAAGPGLTRPTGQLLAALLQAYYKDTWTYRGLAVSGSVLYDVTNNQAPQLASVKPNVVFLISGGNDLNYVRCLGNPSDTVCTQFISPTEFKNRYTAALDAIVRGVNYDTNVKIYGVSYIGALDSGSNCGSGNSNCPFNSNDYNKVVGIYDAVCNGIEDSINSWKNTNDNAKYKVTFLDVRKDSRQHRLGSGTPWINGANAPLSGEGTPWHPNQNGSNNVAYKLFQGVAVGGILN